MIQWWWYCFYHLADVCLCWQMLLPLFMAVGIAIMVVLPRFVPNLYMVCWQMLLPYGWCYCHICVSLFLNGRCYYHVADVSHYYVLFLLADVIAMWLMLLPLFVVMFGYDVIAMVGCVGRCYCLVADGFATGSIFILILIHLFCVLPHPICVAVGICPHFCLGMGHWPLWTELL